MLIRREQGWIYRRNWDLAYIIGSSILVLLPIAVASCLERFGGVARGRATGFVNMAVAALIGGPHLFSTATLTVLDARFVRSRPWFVRSASLLPFAVVYLGVYHYQLLIQIFFAWASLHVLQQLIFISDCYRARSGAGDPGWSRAIDYGVILTALYPVGLAKMAEGKFGVAGVVLPYPEWARPLHLPVLAAALFAALLAAFAWKSVREWNAGVLSLPKTLLISVASAISFSLPLGSNLDVMFQGYNTWHSFQYLVLFWFVNRLRYFRGEELPPVVAALVRRRNPGAYYGALVAATLVLVAVTLAIQAFTPLSAEQSYFIVVLSVLLVHYYFDHFLFTQTDVVVREAAAGAMAG